MPFKPMLAAQKYQSAGDLWTPKHEAIVVNQIMTDQVMFMQPKIDGFRYLFWGGVCYSRSWTPWKQRYVQMFAKDFAELLTGVDGEGTPGFQYDPEIFREAMSGLRAEEGSREFTFYIFDFFGTMPDGSDAQGQPYLNRIAEAKRRMELMLECYGDGIIRRPEYSVKLVLCPTHQVFSLDEIYTREEEYLSAGWEGGILRRPYMGYKQGRSSALQGALVKLKRFLDMDVRIKSAYEAETNNNELTTSALGYAKRSAHQANKVGKGMLGGFVVSPVDKPEIEFGVGVLKGMTAEEKTALWEKFGEGLWKGRLAEIKHQGYGGGYDKPRTPVWHRLRPLEEL